MRARLPVSNGDGSAHCRERLQHSAIRFEDQRSIQVTAHLAFEAEDEALSENDYETQLASVARGLFQGFSVSTAPFTSHLQLEMDLAGLSPPT